MADGLAWSSLAPVTTAALNIHGGPMTSPYTSTAILTSAPVSIPFSAHDMELQFWMRMVSEFAWDGGWLEYRIQDEHGNWSLWSEILPTDILKGHYNCLLGAPTGCQGLVHLVSGPHNGWSGEGEPLSGTIRVQVPISATGPRHPMALGL
jgi:hypothetical protein